MHRPFLIVSASMLGLASLAMVAMAASLEPTPVARTASGRDVSTVLRYYDAVNEMIATGDPESLRSVLHAEFIEPGTPETGTHGSGSLESYLRWLHAVAPDTQLVAGPVASDGEQVIAQVSVTTSASSLPLGFSVHDPSLLWPGHEVFRVALGQIIERRAAGFRPPEISLVYTAGATESADRAASADVVTYRFIGITRGRMSTRSMPAIFQVTSGTLVLSLAETSAHPALLLGASRDTAQAAHEEVLPGTTGRAGPGMIMIVPPDSDFSMVNLMREPATLVGVSVALESGIERDAPLLSDLPGFGVSIIEHLRRPLEHIGNGAQLSLGTVRLAPDVSADVSPGTSLMLILDSPGGLLLSGNDSDCRSVLATPEETQPVEPLPPEVKTLCPDTTHGGLLTNVGQAPVTAWVVAVVTP